MWGLLGCGLVAGACGEDSGGVPDDGCGLGTVRQGDQCVVQQAGKGGGGNAPCSGSDCVVGGAPAQAAGTSASDGGRAEDGGVGNQGDAGSNAAGTSGNEGGTGSGAVGGAGGEANPAPDTHWLAFEHEGESFVYDVTQFPSQNAIQQLGDADLGAWSPDGRQLLHGNQGAWYVRDMSEPSPGEPVLLVDPPGSLPVLRWSADSQSLAMQTGTTLSVFGTTQAAPLLNTVTTTLVRYSWCPVGNKLLYVDASGAHIVSVVAGVPGAPLSVSPITTTWSPTGLALAGQTSLGGLAFTNLATDSPTLTTIFEPTVPESALEGLNFSPDGSRIATYGWIDDLERSDAFYVNVLPTVGELTTPYAAPPGDWNSAAGSFSPDSNWLFYDSNGDFAVNVSGATPGAPIPLVSGPLAWLPNSVKLITADSSTTPATLSILDLLAPDSPQTLLSGVAYINFKLDPAGTRFSYQTQLALHLFDIAAPQEPHVDIPLLELSGNVGSWDWSPDGNFIVAVAGSGSRRLRLVHVDGLTVSSAVDLWNPSTATIRFQWQP
jgi:WD40 repeat protein